MKVFVNQTGPFRGLCRHLQFEGDQVVQGDEAELVIQDPLDINPQVLGLETSEGEPTHYVTKFWSGQGWSDSTFVGLPMIGMMDWGKGDQTCTGSVGRYIPTNGHHAEFTEPSLEAFLKELGHHGFVSAIYSNDTLSRLQTEVPFWGLYAILEGLEGEPISHWWQCPTKLYETWVGSLLVSRYPYPHASTGERVAVIVPEEEHVWLLGGSTFRDTWTTSDNELCIITGMDHEHGGINNAARKIRRLAEGVKVEGVQYRTDMAEFARIRWSELKERGVV